MTTIFERLGEVEYRRLLTVLKDSRPDVPAWDGKVDNTEDWKYKSGLQAGYDLCLTKLGIELN